LAFRDWVENKDSASLHLNSPSVSSDAGLTFSAPSTWCCSSGHMACRVGMKRSAEGVFLADEEMVRLCEGVLTETAAEASALRSQRGWTEVCSAEAKGSTDTSRVSKLLEVMVVAGRSNRITKESCARRAA
jgi:hypothetical protein